MSPAAQSFYWATSTQEMMMSVSGAAIALNHAGATASARVLVADDDPTSRLLVGAALEGHVRGLEDVENGLEAVRALEKSTFDIAILDLDMPVMDGFGVIERARLRPETRHLPIIVVTGRDDVVAIERAFALGATSFLCKPINWSIFRHQVGYVLQVARQEAETRRAKDRAERLAAFRGSGLSVIEARIAEAAARLSKLGSADGALPADEVRQAGRQLDAVLQRVRRASDLLTDAATFEPTRVGAADIAAAAIERMQADLPGSAARIERHGDWSLDLACDREQGAVALEEVLRNAVQVSPTGARVRLGVVAAPNERIRFEVADAGPGIPEHLLERGIEALPAGGGSGRVSPGLGLATARMIVERHGGHFSMMSETGRGTEVFLSFPATMRVDTSLG